MIDPSDLIRQLSQVEHFRGIPLEKIGAIISSGHLQRYPAGKIVFFEDEPSSGMYVLLSGRIQLFKLSPQGQMSILSVLEPVIMFNEVPAVDGGPNPVTAICLENCLLWKLTSSGLEELVLRHPQIGLGMLRVMARRNRTLVSKFQDLSFRTVLSRAVLLLLELSENGQKPIDRRLHPNHQMAARVASVPEAFSRCLKVLRTYGDIAAEARVIRVLNPEHLRQIAESGLPEPDHPQTAAESE